MTETDDRATDVARKDALLKRLTDEDHLSTSVAERWFGAWEREAAGRELGRHDPDFWIDGHAWIVAGVKARRRV